MRLSQLARKLEISPTELLSFFRKSSIGRYTSQNNKIKEEHETLATQHFMPESISKTGKEEISENEGIVLVDDGTSTKMQDQDPGNIAMARDKSKKPESTEEEIELIRMPKIKLEGVKVVGKIELPEYPKKSPGKEENADIIADKLPAGKKYDKKKHFEKKYRKGKRPLEPHSKNRKRELSYEEKLRRQEEKRSRELRKAKKLKKDQKKEYYIKNVQSNIKPRAKKTSKDIEEICAPAFERPEYKNPIRKFWAWLNGEYDSF